SSRIGRREVPFTLLNVAHPCPLTNEPHLPRRRGNAATSRRRSRNVRIRIWHGLHRRSCIHGGERPPPRIPRARLRRTRFSRSRRARLRTPGRVLDLRATRDHTRP